MTTNDRQTFIRAGGLQEPVELSRQLYQTLCPSSVIDAETLILIEVLRLHKALDHTGSATGAAVLLRSLLQPSTDLSYILSKQEALREIASNDKLRQALQDFIHAYRSGESALFKFFNKGLYALLPYPDLKRARRSAAHMAKMATTLPRPASSYLGMLTAHLLAYKGSSVDRMMNGAIYKTFNGIQSDKDIGLFTPKQQFIPRRFSRWMAAGPAVALAPHLLEKAGYGPVSPVMPLIGLGWAGLYLFYSLLIKPVRDTGIFIEPFREKCVCDDAFIRAVDCVGMIDELLSLDCFAREMPHATTLPQVKDDDFHCFEAFGLKNPVLAKERADFVPNDIRMNGAKLTFISGPNSGGKTTICKSIVHNQLLAQIGGYVVAEKAAINIADRISYQAPKFDGLQDDEGRFGTELSRTRDIFYSTGPKSLVILDELAEGTTYEEKLHTAFGILSDFHAIGNNTVLVTHNHALVERLMEAGKGQCRQAEFIGDEPTYHLIPGVSRVAHAEKIAEKIHFGKADRKKYLKEKGYI